MWTITKSGDGTPRVKLNYRKTSTSNVSEPASSYEELPKSNAIEFKTDAIPIILGEPVEYDALLTGVKELDWLYQSTN